METPQGNKAIWFPKASATFLEITRTMKTMRKPNEGCTKRRKTVAIRLDRITFSVNPMSIENRSINDVRQCKRTATINFCKRTGITATGCRFWSTIPIMSQI